MLDGHRHVPASRGGGKLEGHLAFLLGDFHAIVFEFLHLAVEDLGEARPSGSLAAHRVRQVLHAPYLLVLVGGHLLFAETAGLFLLEELRVVALVLAQLPVAQRQHAVDRLVEQRQVVADHEHGAAKALELVEEPALRRFVEVVRGLVENHRFGHLVEHAHQVHAAALAARQGAQVLEQQSLVESQARGEPCHFGLGLVAAALTKRLFKFGEALDGLFGRISGERMAGVLHVGVELIEPPRRQDVREADRLDAEAPRNRLLGKVADLSLVLYRAGDAQVLWRVAEQHRKQCRLAGAVSPDQADLLAVSDRERHRVENTACANLYTQIPDYKHLAP